MNRLQRAKRITLAWMAAGLLVAAPVLAQEEGNGLDLVVNPYAGVDWAAFEQHMAQLHMHTLQSDGSHPLEEVLAAYTEYGFSILAITDHDIMAPNRAVAEGEEGSPYPDPRPERFPANTTWPWTDYGAPSPEDLGILGIEANELTDRHHMNSFFNGYGVLSRDKDEDEQLRNVNEHGGIAFIDHPGIAADWWTRQPVEWYVERYEQHGPEYLVGIEVTNNNQATEKYDEGLWDQLLARFMPERPIWGFGTDDMHRLNSALESHSVFVLDALTEEALRDAMLTGQFYFVKSNRRNDIREREPASDLYPHIQEIRVDEEAGTIRVIGGNYDRIVWISAPASLEAKDDYVTSNEPWPLGTVVHEGASINYQETDGIDGYLRFELHREDGGELFRAFSNPFGFASADE